MSTKTINPYLDIGYVDPQAYLSVKESDYYESYSQAALSPVSNLVEGKIYNAQEGFMAGWLITPSFLKSPASEIILNSLNKKISIMGSTFETQGIQLEYNGGTPRAYIGDGANQYFEFDGTNVSWKGTSTSLTAAGLFTAANAVITGTITATDGQIANWYINTNSIADSETEANANVLIDSASTLVRLGPTSGSYINLDGANQRIRSSNYVSGPLGSGFSLEPDLLEVGNIRARGKITTSVFEKDTLSAVGGTLIVANADVLDSDMTAADNSTLTTTGDVSLAVNDILIISDGTDEEYLRVTNIGSAPTYTVLRDLAGSYSADTNPAWKKGTAVVVFGSSDGAATYSGGWLFLNGGSTNSPYFAIVKRTGVAYNAYTEYGRLGNLNGFLSYSSEEYGLAIGDSSNYFTFDPTNGLVLSVSGSNAIIVNRGGNIQLNEGGDIYLTTIDAPGACTAALLEVAGNLSNGNYTYKVTFVTSDGEQTELGTASNTVTADGTHQQVSLSSIPTSSSGNVTARNLYRTKAGGSVYYYLAQIADNSTTTYTDNVADASLVTSATSRENSTAGRFYLDDQQASYMSLTSTAFGYQTLDALTHGWNNTAFGAATLTDLTAGHNNSVFGREAGTAITTGDNNTIMGSTAGTSITTGYENTILGSLAAPNQVSGYQNTYVGSQAGLLSTGDGNVFIGYGAGGSEITTDNLLYIANSSTSTPLIYGDFANTILRTHGYFEVIAPSTYSTITIKAADGYDTALYFEETSAEKWRIHVDTSDTDEPLLFIPAGGTVAQWALKLFSNNNARFEGNLGVGADPSFALHIEDSDDSSPIALFYNTSSNSNADGLLIRLGASTMGTGNRSIIFRDGDNNVVGYIDQEVVYNNFTGGHASQLSEKEKPEVGMIMSSSGAIIGVPVICQALPEIRISPVEKDSCVFGVFAGYPPKDKYKGFNPKKTNVSVNAIGEGQVLITDLNGEVQNGDYITSSMVPGYGMKQDDDVLHNYTVAKITEKIDWSKVEIVRANGKRFKKYLAACTYHCA